LRAAFPIGIDYSLGQSNVNKSTGVHYGVISSHSVPYEYQDDFEQDYGEPHCPKCGNEVSPAVAYLAENPETPEWENYSKHGACDDFACAVCEHFLDSSEVYSEEALGFSYEQEGYKLTNCLDSDIFVLESPFYTRAQFCSPCVPGAGNLDTPAENGPKTYCLGHEWFEDGKAPYPVFKVSDDSEVLPATK